MPFISYAQNFEDIMLWRTLGRCVDIGFYIDVGANDPSRDSVTKAFYDQGWCGINIEPSPQFYGRLSAERRRDINLQIVVSDKEDALTFYDTDDGWSTVDPDVASRLKASGKEIKERSIAAQTLSTICEQYVKGEIHFLKIDVEGHEFSVLSGMDFQRWRPWVLLIESVFNVEPEWGDLLKAARYQFVHRDGINRYFLAEEHMNLADAFNLPPGSLDEFQLCYGHHLSYPIVDLEKRLAYEHKRANEAEAKLAIIKGNFSPFVRLLLQLPRKFLRKLKTR